MLLMHYYTKMSVDSVIDSTMPIYDGYDYYIPPFHSVILVPCNSDDPDHQTPSIDSCPLLIRTGVQTVEKDQLLVVYLIDNTSDVGLLLRYGDLLGAHYTGPHEHIKAERSYMLIGNYNLLVQDQNQYWADVESAIDEINDNDPTLNEFGLLSLNTVNET